MPRSSGEAMHEVVLAALAVFLDFDLDFETGTVGEASHQQPLDLHDEIVRLIWIETQARHPRGDAHSDVCAYPRHASAPTDALMILMSTSLSTHALLTHHPRSSGD